MTIRARKVRNRRFSRVRRSRKMLSFLDAEATRLSGTGTGTTVTYTNATNLVNLTAHGYVDGQGPFLLANSGGALPAELSAVTEYWVNANDANSFTLHTSEADALAGTSIVAFTDDGTGTNTTLVGAESSDIFSYLLAGNTAAQIRTTASIDNLP